MSDPVAAPEQSAPVPQAPAVPALSPEALGAIKSALELALSKAYFGFIDHCRALPIHFGLMQRAFQHLDDGLFCLEKAIRMIESLPLPAPIPADAAIADKVVEGAEVVVDELNKVVNPEPAAPAEPAADASEPAPVA